MKTKLAILVSLSLLVLLGVSAVMADDGGYPWKDHASPYDFLFGNMIDSHQQSRVNPKGKLRGFIYIHYTGEFTEDGYPIAQKAHCDREACDIGWSCQGNQGGSRTGVPQPAHLAHRARCAAAAQRLSPTSTGWAIPTARTARAIRMLA